MTPDTHSTRARRARPIALMLAAVTGLALTLGAPSGASAREHGREPDLGPCDSLRAPEGAKLAARTYAQGVQIYRWTGTAWAFVGPSAVLTADSAGIGKVGIHYSGPTWQSASGGKVVGAVAKRCPSPTGAIPWLLLSAQADDGPGLFQRTTFIQRLYTVGGNAPSTPGATVGEVAEVPYTAEYYFYRTE